MSRRIDLTGRKFGRLTVVKPTKLVLNRIRKRNGVDYEEYRQEYLCLCECGKNAIRSDQVLKSVLKNKGVGSCGCGQRKDKEGEKWSVSFNMLWKNYVCHAAANNRLFELTKNQFNNLINDNCFYCGSVPQSIIKSKSKKKPDQTVYNGVDRVDNSTGYKLNNCVPCCEICNRMKLELGQQTFLAHIAKIFNHSVMSKKLF